MKQEVMICRCETNEDFEIAKTITHDYMIWLGMDLGFQNIDKEFAVFNRMYGEASGAYIYALINGDVAVIEGDGNGAIRQGGAVLQARDHVIQRHHAVVVVP